MIDYKKEMKKLNTEIKKANLTKSLDQLNESLSSIEEKLIKIEHCTQKTTNLSSDEVSHYAKQAHQELVRAYGIAVKFAETCKNVYDIAISINESQTKNKQS